MAYDQPQLRLRLRQRIMAGSKGGRAGQWSARKAQLLSQAYERAGGGYSGPRTAAQRSLRRWTGERWRTSDGRPAIQGSSTRRYLPDAAWRRLSPGQRAATNRRKLEGSRRGRQFIANTRAAAQAGRRVRTRRAT